jgi:hypothetical protein
MNIIEYINTNCKLNTEQNGVVSITISAPPLKSSSTIQDVSAETTRIKIRTSDVYAYLESKGYNNINIVQTATIDNKHPKALNAVWKFKATKKKAVLKVAPQKNKETLTKNAKNEK